MKNKLLLIFALLISGAGFSQDTKTITGTILDESEMPLPGAEVKVVGKEIFSVTDFDGNFVLEGVVTGDVFRVTFLGFEAQEFPIGDNNEYVVTLREDASTLDEVVIIGYGTAQKRDLTGSISNVGSEEITRQPAANALQSIQGRAAGVTITPSGAPGSSPNVIIRGLGTAFGGQDPLYVVDGILTDGISNINPNDIVSMDILKDASSLAIYGNRGANGVIIVTTKKGREGTLEINYDGFSGFRSVLEKVEMADSRQYAIYTNEALGTDRFSETQQYNTDWFDEITRAGLFTSHNLSFSAGSENITTFFSAGFMEEQGILQGNDFNRLNLRSNTVFNLTDRITFTQQVSASLERRVPKPFSAFNNAYKQAPLMPVRYETGPFEGKFGVSQDETGSYNNVGNPVRDLFYNHQKQNDLVLQGSFTFDYEIADWITYTSRFGIETSYFRNKSFTPNLDIFLSGDPTRTRDDYNLEDNARTTLSVTKSDDYKWVLDNFVTLNHSLGELHNFRLTLGTTAEERGGEFLTGIRRNVPDDSDYWSLNNGDEDPAFANNLRENTVRLVSYFGRLNYDFDGKYLLTGTIRRDGSSQFQEGNKFGNFFSVGVGWVISDEEFFRNIDGINFLKLRASYGELGNQNVPLNILTFARGLNYAFGPEQNINEGGTINELIDPELSWETTEEFDIGLEFAFLNNRLSGEIDYYNRLNRDAILPVELPDAFGYVGTTLTPAGQVRNKGLEFSLNWQDQIGEDFTYSLGGNITFNENKLESVTNPFFAENRGGDLGNGQVTKKVVEGEPLGSFWLLEVIDVDEEGNFVYNDVNDDGNINDDDKQFFGSYQPKNFFGLNLAMAYRNWDFNVDGYGNFGNVVYNGKKAQRFGGENIERDVFNNRWTPQNQNNTGPRPSNDVPLASTYFLESGDFFRINNITVGYSIPFKEDSFINQTRIYLTAQNPLIFQDFSGFTPELPGAPLGNAGIELNAYPAVKSYLIGLNISL